MINSLIIYIQYVLTGFKAASGELRRGTLSCDDYFTTQYATLKKLALSDIGSGCQGGMALYEAVVNMIPSAESREDLLLRLPALTFTRKSGKARTSG